MCLSVLECESSDPSPGRFQPRASRGCPDCRWLGQDSASGSEICGGAPENLLLSSGDQTSPKARNPESGSTQQGQAEPTQERRCFPDGD